MLDVYSFQNFGGNAFTASELQQSTSVQVQLVRLLHTGYCPNLTLCLVSMAHKIDVCEFKGQ